MRATASVIAGAFRSEPDAVPPLCAAFLMVSGMGRHYAMIDGDHVAKAAVRDACGAFEVFEVIAQAAPMAPPHVSPWTGVLFLLEGRITAVVGETPHDVEPGGVIIFPAGTPATFGVNGESARFVAVTSGDGAGKFFADFANSVPVGQPIEQAMESIVSVTRRHGVAVAANAFPASASGTDAFPKPHLTAPAVSAGSYDPRVSGL